MATMRDIARKAGVGVGTVSRALSNTGYTAKETREKILAAALAVGYDYETAVRARAKAASVGILLPMLHHPFFGTMADALESELRGRGFGCLLFNNCKDGLYQPSILDMLESGGLSGLIALDSPPADFAGRGGRAIVAMDRNWGGDVPLVHSDHVQGGRLAAEAFLEAGCASVIQFMGGELTAGSNVRHIVMEKILRERGCHVTTIHAVWNSMGYPHDQNMVKDYWNVIQEMAGCMTNDIAAAECLAQALDAGLEVPGRLRIIAHDGTEIASLCRPGITSIEQNCPALAAACADRLLELMEGDEPAEMETVVPILLRKRGTT